MNLNSLDRCSKNTQILNFLKSVQWYQRRSMRIDLWTDGHTDMMKLRVAFRNFAKVPKRDNYHELYKIMLTCPLRNTLFGLSVSSSIFPDVLALIPYIVAAHSHYIYLIIHKIYIEPDYFKVFNFIKDIINIEFSAAIFIT